MRILSILKNRLVIGCICIIAAFAVGFIAVPALTDRMNDKISVVVASQDIPKGAEITESMFRMIRMSKGDLPYSEGEYYNYSSSAVVPSGRKTDIRSLFTESTGKLYASSEMKANDILTSSKLTDTNVYKDEKLRALGANQYAVAVTVNTVAEGIAAKVMTGDIVMPLVFDKNLGYAKADPRLMYVEVLNVLDSSAAEINDSEDGAVGIPSVVTFKVNLDQAFALATYENTAEIHLALVCRGNDAKRAELLKKQNEYLSGHTTMSRDSWYFLDPSVGKSTSGEGASD